MQEFSINICEADFLEGVIGGDNIEPISREVREERKLSIYEKMVRSTTLSKRDIPHASGGGGAAARN